MTYCNQKLDKQPTTLCNGQRPTSYWYLCYRLLMALVEAYFMTQNNSFHLLCTTRHCGTCFFSAEFWHNAIDNVDPVEKVYNYTHAHTHTVCQYQWMFTRCIGVIYHSWSFETTTKFILDHVMADNKWASLWRSQHCLWQWWSSGVN